MQPPLVRFEGLLGEFSEHDFGQLDVTFVDGRKLRVHFLASRLEMLALRTPALGSP